MTNTRNCNIDIVRIISMTLVTCIHFLCYNNLWGNQDMPVYNRVLFDSVMVLTYCYINLFVLISGYLLCEKEFKLNRIISTWSLVWVTCVTTAIIVCIINHAGFSINGMIRSIFPVLTGSYWYIISYFLLLWAAPFINQLLAKYNEHQIRNVLLMIGVLLSVLMSFNPMVKADTYVGSESSIFWFCYLYAIGGYIRKYGIKYKKAFIIFGLLSFLLMLASSYYSFPMPAGIRILNLMNCFSLILSIAIFDCIVNANFDNLFINKLLSNGIVGKCSLCVFIIQENYFFRNYFWSTINPYQYKDSPMLIVVWIFCVVLLWIFAAIVYKWYELLKRLFLSKIEVDIESSITRFYNKMLSR